MPNHSATSDRRPALLIFLITFACYAYFFQGLGWNQMAHFATIRSLAERGNAEISQFSDFTKDFAIFNGHAYSNKPPGLVLLGTPPYFLLITIERCLGIDFTSDKAWIINMHLITILLSAFPGALLNVLLFFAFRREGAPLRTALLLTGAFAFGSLNWPYTGILLAHILCAFCVFAAWYLLSNPTMSARGALLAGAMMGVALMSDLLMLPVAAIFFLYLCLRKLSPRLCILYLLGPCAGVLLMLLYNRLAHGDALASGPFHPPSQFTSPGLFLGLFAPPDWRRLYWITYEPMRGIFLCCPIFLICILALFTFKKPIRFRLDYLTILLILLLYLAFYLTYFSWTGGWGVGLRFMIPAFALFWLVALKPFQKYPLICGIFITLSIFNMLCVTAVRVLYPTPDAGPPNRSDPIRGNMIVFLQGHTNRTEFGHNLASLLHIPEKLQLLPILALLLIYYGYAFSRPKNPPNPILHPHRLRFSNLI